MTLKGIQPEIDRITRKHKENCEDIKCQMDVSKQKLEVQCEEELMFRIQEFQRSEQQARTSVAQRNDIAQALSYEQNEHIARLKKLKEAQMEELENAKKMYQMELETVAKEIELKTSKPDNSRHLELNLKNKREQRKYEMEAELEHINTEMCVSKREWEDARLKASKTKQEGAIKELKKSLLELRETKINDLIKASIIEQAKLDDQMRGTDESIMESEHQAEVQSIRQKLSSTLKTNNELKAKLTATGKSRDQLLRSLAKLQQDFDVASNELDDLIGRKMRKQKQHNELLAETSKQIERTLKSVSDRKEQVKCELDRVKDNMDKESRYDQNIIPSLIVLATISLSQLDCLYDDYRLHDNIKSTLEQEHGERLDELQQYARKAANELDRKLHALRSTINEKEVYLSKAQDLFCTRYKKVDASQSHG